jgi:signal peptidase I
MNTNTEVKPSTKQSVMSWIRFGLLLVMLFIVFRYVIGITLVNGNSMNPTLENKNVLLMSKYFYDIEQSDIVLVEENGFNIIKRVVAMPNDTVKIENGEVFINGEKLVEEYTKGISFDVEEFTIPENHYFIVGDNRTLGESLDSRDSSIGPINKEQIVGNAIVKLFPFSTL